MQAGLQIARLGFRVYAETEFDSVERERKKLKVDEYNCEKKLQDGPVYEPEILSVEADLTHYVLVVSEKHYFSLLYPLITT